MSEPHSISLLGATGSVGTSTLDVVSRHPGRFRIVAVTARSNVRALGEICARELARRELEQMEATS